MLHTLFTVFPRNTHHAATFDNRIIGFQDFQRLTTHFFTLLGEWLRMKMNPSARLELPERDIRTP